jgi:hypothetical protein
MMYDDSESEVPNYEMCDRVATNTDWVPQQTLLAVAVSIRPLSSSTAKDSDTAKEDGPPAPSSTKSQTWAVEVLRASSSALTSHRAACSAQFHLAASSKWSASRA